MNQDYLSSKLTVSSSPSFDPKIPTYDGSISYDVCIFHAPCNDGTAAAYSVSLKFPDCDFFGVNRGSGTNDAFLSTEFLDSKIAGKNIVLVDYVFPKYTMMELVDCANHVLVIDHHISEYNMLKTEIGLPESQFVFSIDFAACVLTWKYFSPSLPIPPLISYVNDSDIAQYLLSNTSLLISGMAVQSPVVGPGLWTQSRDDPFREFHRAISRDLEYIRSMMLVGIIAREIEWRDIYTDAQRCLEKRLKIAPNLSCRIVNVSPGPRMGALANALLSGSFSDPPSPPCDIALLYYRIDVNQSYKISLRSSDTNVGKIARLLGGGGHTQAASLTVYASTIDHLFEEDIANESIEDILARVSRPSEDWSVGSFIDLINGMRNDWKLGLTEREIEMLKSGCSEAGSQILQFRGLKDISVDCDWCGIGLMTSGRIVFYRVDGDQTIVSKSRCGLVEDGTVLEDTDSIWPLYEGGYMEYFFWDSDNHQYVSAESLEAVDDDGKVKKLVKLSVSH